MSSSHECGESLPSHAVAVQDLLHAHSNENLLKIDTYDKYSTITVIKKKILKDLGVVTSPSTPHTETESGAPSVQYGGGGGSALFPGLRRMSKNPRNTYMFLAFDTPAHRAAALAQLERITCRGHTWKEVPVNDRDLQVTHKGQHAAEASRRKQQQQQRAEEREEEEGGDRCSSASAVERPSKVAQFAHLSKAEQLDRKTKHCLTVMKRILPSNVYGWDTYAKRFDGIRESPVWVGYRNHVQLSFGWTEAGEPGLGFWTGSLVEGCASIQSVVPWVEDEEAPLPPPTEQTDAGEADGTTTHLVTVHPLALEVARSLMAVVREFHSIPSSLQGSRGPVEEGVEPAKKKSRVETEAVEQSAEEEEEGVRRRGSPPNPTPTTTTGEETRLDVFDKRTGEGFWRKAQIRHNIYGEVMVDLEVDPHRIPAALFQRVIRERLVEVVCGAGLAQRLRAAAVAHDGTNAAQQPELAGLHPTQPPPQPGVVSLQYHAHSGIRSLPPDTPRVLLHGESPWLTEYVVTHAAPASPLLPRRLVSFHLGPTTFFQVNTGGLQQMLDGVVAAAALDRERTILLDLCSGVGTLGICLAHRVEQVIGIEIVEEAVMRARENVQRNGITNATYHAGRVEVLLPQVLSTLTPEQRASDVVALLDPPRAGVGSVVLKWIRGTAAIRTAVYISCEQKALERDCPLLTKPATKAYRGVAFEVRRGFGVDMFPHTHHVEMVAVLVRKDEEEEEEAKKKSDEDETAPVHSS